jgi:SAM-dependent methyltransferase
MSLAETGNNLGQTEIVEPLAEFYATYNAEQIRDIVDGLENHEIPHHYNYLGGGAEMWDRYASGLANDAAPNLVKDSSRLLDLTADYVDELIDDRSVTIVDLGPGNGYPMRSTLQRFTDQGRLNRYIGIDISADVLAVLRANVRTWFGDLVECEAYVRNFSDEGFGDLLQTEARGSADSTSNLVFLLGGTLNNFTDPVETVLRVRNSMRSRDLLLYGGYLDTEHVRREVQSSGVVKKEQRPSDYLPHLLGLTPELCNIELTYDETEQARMKVLRPRSDLELIIDLDGRPRHLELKTGKEILLWRRRHYTMGGIVNLFESNGFELQQATKSANRNHVSLILRPEET